MTTEELLQECFGRTDFPPPRRVVEMRDDDTGDVQAHVGVYFRRLIVRYPSTPGAIVDGSTTIQVAALERLCVAPEHRGKGFAQAMVKRAHTELMENRPLSFVTVLLRESNPGAEKMLDRLGYLHHPGTPDGLWVRRVGDEDWPAGTVRLAGDWER